MPEGDETPVPELSRAPSIRPVKEEFQMSFEGEAVHDNTMDAAYIGDSITGMQSLLNEANLELYGSDSAISVKVKGFRPGSFETEFIVTMSGQTVTAICNTITLIGFVGVGVAALNTGIKHLIEFIKKTRGKKVETVRAIDDSKSEVRIIGDISGNANIIVENLTLKLSNNRKVRENLYKTLSPLQFSGIDKVRYKGRNNIVTEIKKEDLPSFVVPEDEVNEEIRVGFVLVTQTNLLGKNRGWRFSFDDINPENDFSAEVKDRTFLQRVKSGEYRFSRGTTLHIRYYHRQKITAITNEIHHHWEILEVLEYRPPNVDN